ncbi:MAG: decaprenyl-phosphate phosphoribosyltransferase [Chloroflexi bacterium]|nr:decaprenyl-phosphate phosphoribosyltransferase [Chloroflexota bacterium]
MLLGLLRSMRPRQWAKNVFLFAALVFDLKLLQPGPFLRTLAGFLVFCLASSVVYLVNDVADIESDRQHPLKRSRPIASGIVPARAALLTAGILGASSLAAGFLLGTAFGAIVAGFLALNLAYSFWLKHVPILDVFSVAAGFVLRVGAGVSLIAVTRFSPWLYVCMTLLALYIGFGKRRAEMVLVAGAARDTRRVLDGYTIPFLDQLIVIVSATTIVAYSLYTFSAENLPDNHTMMLTIPFVFYGLFRYLYLIHVENSGGAPEELVFKDRPLMATLLLWGLAAVAVLYLGQ